MDGTLASQFDDDNAAVRQARATVRQLAGALPNGAPVQLGAALNELRNLRTVHALTPPADAVPASASSVASHGGATP